jgi:hypothetical protein
MTLLSLIYRSLDQVHAGWLVGQFLFGLLL